MTVTALVTRNDITATASQTSFTYTFRVLAATDMDVYQNGVLLSSGYTVNDVGNTTGGTVVLDSGVPVGQIVSLVLAMPLDRTTNYQNSGKFLADDVNEDFDKIYIGAVQNENEGGRSLRLKDVEPPTVGVDMTIPLKDDRKGKLLSFNSITGAPEASTASVLYDSAAYTPYNFTGDGSTVAFTLGSTPNSENNTQVYIDGIYQQKDGYSVSGTVLTFSVAPPNLSTIEVMVTSALAVGATSSDLVSYTPAGAGSVTTTVQTKLRESVSVKDFGAVGDGVTDDTVAIQAAIDASDHVVFPSGTYEFNGITIDGPATETGAGKVIDASEAYLQDSAANSTSMFKISGVSATNFLDFKAKSITILAGGGHVFDMLGSVNHCQFDVDYIMQKTTNKSIINCPDFSFFFNKVTGLYWSLDAGHTVPAINFVTTTNKVSANNFNILRPNRSGTVPYFVLTNSSVSEFNYSNEISLSNPERCNGGVLKLSRAMNTVVNRMNLFDSGTIVNHVIELGTSGVICQNTKIRDYQRNGGTLSAGKKDIMVTDGSFTYIEGVSGLGSTTIEIDLSGEPNGVVIGMFKTDVINKTTGNTTIIDSETGVYTPTLTMPLSGNILTIASGAITVTDSVHRVDTEGAAATDDLTTINGGVDGQILLLRSTANARDTTLKDTGGNLLLAGDFVLDRDQDLITLHYSSDLSSWVEISRSSNA